MSSSSTISRLQQSWFPSNSADAEPGACHLDLSHLTLIRRYPFCFKSSSNEFEDFIVDSISVLFEKSDSEIPKLLMTADTVC